MSAFFGARAPELVPEQVQDLNVKPAQQRKQPLHERSLSDLNKTNNGKPTIRLVDSDHDSDIYSKSPFPSLPSQVLKPPSENTRKQKDPVYIDVPTASSRPASREGPTGPRSYHSKRPNRISVSTTTSNADTLVADSLFSPTSRRFSTDSNSKTAQPHYSIEGQGLVAPLEPLEELSSDRVDLQSSDMPDIPELPSSVPSRPHHMAHSSSVYSSSPFAELQETPTRQRPRSSSSGLGFCVSPLSEEDDEEGDAVRAGPASKASKDSMAESAQSESTQERGTPHIIRYMSSNDSLQPQFASIRPAPYHSRSASSLWSSGSVDDQNVAPLHVPRKRGHMHSASLNSYPSMTRLGASHLSTIASETEMPESSRMSQQSPGMAGYSWPKRRKTVTSSSYSESVASPQIDQVIKASSSYDTMSSGLHSDSAMPEPLFSSSAPIPQRPFDPNSSHLTDELGDTIGELQAPPLREKRSGYFVRKRSHTELRPASRQSNHTTIESERWSTGSFIFPQWAQFFYGGKAQLLSAKPSLATLAGPQYGSANTSRITLAGPPYGMIDQTMTRSLDLPRLETRGKHHRTGTIDTVATRPSSSHSNWETIYTESPASRIVHNIFRPRNRPRSQTDATQAARDSMSIFSEPEIQPVPAPPTKSSLRSSLRHPLRQNPTRGAPATLRKASGRNSKATLPPHAAATAGVQPTSRGSAPMPSYTSFPHLIPNRRLAQSLSAWRVPSIDEPFPAEMLGPGNRQIVCFCLGFLFPPLWFLAAFLPLPRCGWRDQADRDEQGVTADGEETWIPEMGEKSGEGENRIVVEESWSWDDERRFLKARWWRTLNRVMSVVGVGILGAIIALAVLASRG